AMTSEPAIQMPSGSLPEPVKEPAPTTLVEAADVIAVKAESYDCPFCHHPNDAQTITCDACKSVLTLSDLEMLLANQNSEKAVVRRAVEEMERQRSSRELTVDELVTLGLG